ncbi:uncharacterized protein B0H18DRAFT_1045379, partial [Fomitopsis serialis]|uniref:uncharacterized protein n=1 Tax=Fomitopsis serialis TaxID=139415 RepID=UPI002008B65E
MPHPRRAYPYPWVVLPVSYPGSLWVGIPRWSLRGFELACSSRFSRAIHTSSRLLAAVPTPTARSSESVAFARGALALCARGRRVPHARPSADALALRVFVGRVRVLGSCPARARSACAPARLLRHSPWVHVVAVCVVLHVAAASCACGQQCPSPVVPVVRHIAERRVPVFCSPVSPLVHPHPAYLSHSSRLVAVSARGVLASGAVALCALSS